MSDELPDDVSKWPTDPFALLGVRPGVDPTELKRAYTRLIRRFKPEQWPEQFRRIREAYDQLLQYARFYLQYGQDSELLPDPVESTAPSEPSSPSTAAPRDPLAEAWQVAISGDTHVAFRRLREVHETSNDSNATIRLYWLATLFPEFESERKPVEWLVAALRRSNLAGPARELFRREMLDHPRAALHPAIAELWQIDASVESVAELADWRWRAAALVQEWSIVEDDLGELRDRVLAGSESAWLRLLSVACDLLAWPSGDRERQTWHQCLEEIASMEHLAREHDDVFDRLDLLKIIAGDWHTRWTQNPYMRIEILRLLPLAWTRSFNEICPMYWYLADQIRESPYSWLDKLETLRSSGPTALAFLADQFQLLPIEGVDFDPSPHSVPQLGAFLVTSFWQDYENYRRDLLGFCLRTEVSPTWVANMAGLAGAVGADGKSPYQVAQRDGAIRMIYHAVMCLRG